jgi:dipeptidyl aminopeptidase/acylaminoacyl peptidase
MKKEIQKAIFIAFSLIISYCQLLAQKKIIDTSVYGKWPSVSLAYNRISNDGNYMAYIVRNQPAGSSTAFIRSIHADWKKDLGKNVDLGDWQFGFSQDSRKYIFIHNDSLGIGTLGQSTLENLPDVQDFQLFDKDENNNWLVYRKKGLSNQIVVRDLQTKTERHFIGVQEYFFSQKTQRLFLQTDKDSIQEIQCINLNNFETKKIWSGKLVGSIKLNESGGQIAFIGNAQGENSGNTIFYYTLSENQAVKLADAHSVGIDGQYEIQNINDFNDVNVCFIVQGKRLAESPKSKFVAVDIYSYKDALLQSEQLPKVNDNPSYTAIVRISDRKVSTLEQKGVKLISTIDDVINNHGYVLVTKYTDGGNGVGKDEWNWNTHAKFTVYLRSLRDASLRSIIPELRAPIVYENIHQSPDGKYVVYYDPLKGNYFSYEVETGVRRNITQFVHTNWTMFDAEDGNDELIYKYMPVGVADFLNNGKSVIIYDRRDIYQFDLSGERPAICLTNHYGVRHNIEFRLTMDNINSDNTIGHEKLIINAFNHTTKYDGFFCIHLDTQRNPEQLTMQPNILDGIAEYEVGGRSVPVKARAADSYIIQRQNALEAPNLFWTSDFKSFKKLTSLAPQKDYNWLTSRLITWKTFDGTTSQGILFKPENFDPKKRYPIIFFYYERFSNSLNRFLIPEENGAEIDVPTFISKGYLVFIPDIHYPLGTGQGFGCYNSVVSAAKYFAKMPWVDTKRMGINGHSRGGFETLYLITHSHLFAAAIAGSGYSDAISLYTRVRPDGTSAIGAFELTHQRMNTTLWEKPRIYIENSPILKVDKVFTPVLMMNNKNDHDIPFEQGAEFFNALRRLGKKAWMLQYDGAGHVTHGNAAADLSIRMQQFFDHYLQGAPPPNWMTRGVPADLKQIDNGLVLDNSGAIP